MLTTRSSSLRRGRARATIAGGVAVAITVAGVAITTGGPAAGAADLPNSQSVGRFLDGSLGTSPIQQIADIADARAVNPGTVSDQNPLNVNVLKAIDLPLTGALQLDPLLGIHLGAVNQVASAKSNGESYGASGAVANSGGVSVGGDNNAFPADASIHLDAGLSALADLKLNIGAVSALAQTPAGKGTTATTAYGIAGLGLSLSSPILTTLLTSVTKATNSLLDGLGLLPKTCTVTGALGNISLLGGAVTLDATTGTLTINIQALLDSLHLNLNNLPANTDVLDYVIDYISDPSKLGAGLADTISSTLTSLENGLGNCLSDNDALKALLSTLTGVTSAVTTTIGGIVSKLKVPVNGATTLSPITDALKKVVDIGINVQPNTKSGNYTDKLKATPSQATPVVDGQTVVRAIEVNVLGGSLLNLALANAAAGPSNPAGPPTTPPTTVPPTAPPTGVPAGFAKPSHGSELPLILLVVGLFIASGGAVAVRAKGKRLG